MRTFLAGLLLLTLALPADAQGPSADWQTIETQHFRIHYPREYADWAARAASRLESIRAAVSREVGFDPPQKIDLLITNPVAQANGMALPLLDSPRMVFFTEPPGPDEQIGAYAHWIDLLAVHEVAHVVHMLRPSRNPVERLAEKWVLPLNPITLRAPRWVLEGYATVIEGRLTGSGRPNSAIRALILRRWAQSGRMPSYAQLDSDSRFLGMSMAYLAGSAYLEWLEARSGPDALRNLWARMTARQRRSFDSAFEGVFGEKPERMYGRFVAELTDAAMTVDRATLLQEGEVFQQTSNATGDPAVSPDGSQLAIVIRQREIPSKLVIWNTGEPVEEEKKERERLEKILARDPQDVAPIRRTPIARKPLHTLSMPSGADILTPRWLRDGQSLLFASRMPDSEGFLHFDLFRWVPSSGRVDRITHLADVRDADPLPDGRRAIAIRSRHGKTELVLVDLGTGAVDPLTPADVNVVYTTPRVSPDGDEVAFVTHREGRWRLALYDLEAKTMTMIAAPTATNVASPAWLSDDELLSSVASGGFVELARIDRSGTTTELTRSAGGAFDATVGPDRIYFMSLDPEGFVLRVIPRDVAPAAARAPIERSLVPALPPLPPRAAIFEEAPLPPARSYGIGRQEFGWLVGQNIGPDQRSTEVGVRFGDVVGRLDTLVIGSMSDDAGQQGGALAFAWRGWPVEMGAHLFSARERWKGEDGAGRTELERSGTELHAAWRWNGPTQRLSLRAGGLVGDGENLGFGEAIVSARQIRGSSHFEEEVGVWADQGDGTHLRSFASIRARLGSLRLSGRYQHDQLSSVGEGRGRTITVGGLPSSIVPVSAFATRVLEPALPPGTLSGDRYDGWRVDASIAGPLSIFYQRHDADDVGLGLAGVEISMAMPPSPLTKTPGLQLTAGGAKIFDAPLRGETKYWIAVTWRP